MSKKDTNVELNFHAKTEIVTEINVLFQNSIVSNRQNAQKLRYKNEQKIKEKSNFFEDDLDNENE